MFGRNKINAEEFEKIQQSFEQLAGGIAESGKIFSANSEQIDNSHAQMKKNLDQVDENIQNTAIYTTQNIEAQDIMAKSMKETMEKMAVTEQEYNDLIQQLFTLAESSMNMVEQNKHFTSPSKNISEGVASLHGFNKDYTEELKKLQDSTKQMSVFALNSAIEAGRLGDSGKSFVAATEDVRNLSQDMDAVIVGIQKKVEDSEEKINKLQEEIHKLVGLLKDNNVAMGQLLKQNQSTIRMIEESSLHSYVEDVTLWKEQIAGMRNTDDEIFKMQARNRMQLEDIESEMKVQKKAMQEMSDELTPMFSVAQEHAGEEIKETEEEEA